MTRQLPRFHRFNENLDRFRWKREKECSNVKVILHFYDTNFAIILIDNKFQASAVHSISIAAPKGNPATANVALAGGLAGKY